MFVGIARKCLHELGEQQPTMFEVVANLDVAFMLLNDEPKGVDVVVNVGTGISSTDPTLLEIHENVDPSFSLRNMWSDNEQMNERLPLFQRESQLIPTQLKASPNGDNISYILPLFFVYFFFNLN